MVLASACGALVSVLLALADSSRVRGMVFWLAGDLEWAVTPWLSAGRGAARGRARRSSWRGRSTCSPPASCARARSALALDAWRSVLFIACATFTAIAVVSVGTVGFVGLITPHAVRLAFRTSDHRIVAPAAALAGGTLLAAADLVARTIAAPRQLPVGRDHGAGRGAAVRRAAAPARLGHQVRRGGDAIAAGALGAVERRIGVGDQPLGEHLVVTRARARGAPRRRRSRA